MDSTLYDRKKSLPVSLCALCFLCALCECRQASRRPADTPLTGVARGRFFRLPGNYVIELHDYIDAEVASDFHYALGREEAARAIDVALKLDTFLADRAERRQREHLEPPGIREDRPGPAHEAVKAAELAD